MQADFKEQEDADSASKIDPKHALITLVAGLTVRYYLLDIIKVMVILAILLADASFVTALFARSAYHSARAICDSWSGLLAAAFSWPGFCGLAVVHVLCTALQGYAAAT